MERQKIKALYDPNRNHKNNYLRGVVKRSLASANKFLKYVTKTIISIENGKYDNDIKEQKIKIINEIKSIKSKTLRHFLTNVNRDTLPLDIAKQMENSVIETMTNNKQKELFIELLRKQTSIT